MPREPNPLLPLPEEFLESVVVEHAGVPHRARRTGRVLDVDRARVSTSWAITSPRGDWQIRVGERVPAFLSRHVAPEQHSLSLAAGVIIAAIAGHPRRDEPGTRIQFVWTDHIALAAGVPLERALEISHVNTRQGRFIKSMEGRIRIDRS